MKMAILQMMLSKGIGEVALRRFCETASRRGCHIPADGFLDSQVLCEEYDLSEVLAKRVVDQLGAARQLFARLQESHIDMIWIGHPAFPKHALMLLGRKMPPVLFLKGNCALLDFPGVGFCGSRKASERGLSITELCANQVVNRGYSVVSGYAAGVDEHAHCAAMRSNGRTVIVLAEGILHRAEKPSVRTFENDENHLYVSQFPPDCPWFAYNAMRRNELILGLSRAMIVIEAGAKGGSLAAGESSLAYKEPLFVIDYKNEPPTAVGNKALLRKGALPIRSSQCGTPSLERLFHHMESVRKDNMEVQLQLSL